MPTPGAMIQSKAEAMAKAMNDAIKKKRDEKIKELEKAGAKAGATAKPGAKPAKSSAKATTPDKQLWTVEMRVASEAFKRERSPESQAEMIAQLWSWTCSSAHLIDKARHVDLYAAKPGTTNMTVMQKPSTPFGDKDEHFMTYNEWIAEWNKAMKAQDLRNYAGANGFNAKDAYHVELPNSRTLHSDKAVQDCMAEYARLSRVVEGKYKINKDFENDKHWKSDLAPFIKKAEAEKAKQDEEKRREEIKKLRFDGKLSVSRLKLVRAANKSARFEKSGLGEILPPSPIDAGKAKTQRVEARGVATWDSLARDIFEKIGLAPTNGFDVRATCGVGYDLVSYENLSQQFLTNLTLWVELEYNTPAAQFCKFDADVSLDLILGKTDDAPKGKGTFELKLTSPVNTTSATVPITVTGPKVQAKDQKL